MGVCEGLAQEKTNDVEVVQAADRGADGWESQELARCGEGCERGSGPGRVELSGSGVETGCVGDNNNNNTNTNNNNGCGMGEG